MGHFCRSFLFLSNILLIGFILCVNPSIAQDTSSSQEEGLRSNTPSLFAITNAKIVVAPGRIIESGTLVVENGKIIEVGPDANVPKGAVVIDGKSKTIYPGLIDSLTEQDVSSEPLSKGAPYWNDNIRPQLNVADQFEADSDANSKLRSQGFGAKLVAPKGGIIKGTSVIALTKDGSAKDSILNAKAAQHFRLTTDRSFGRRGYPNSPMGAYALARQAIYDAQWYQKSQQAIAANPNLELPERNDALAALEEVMEAKLVGIVDTSNELFVMRAHRYASEFGIRFIIRGSGNEYRRLEEIKATGRPIIVPVDFPKPPSVIDANEARRVSLEDLMHWDHAPENPGRLANAGVEIMLTTDGLEDVSSFLKNVRKAIDRGLSGEVALAALTTVPAKAFGVDHQLGTLERGKVANLIVTDGPLFADKTEIKETWVAGERFEFEPAPTRSVGKTWTFQSSLPDGPSLNFELVIKQGKRTSAKLQKAGAARKKETKPAPKKRNRKADADKDEESDKDESITLKNVKLDGARFSATVAAKDLGQADSKKVAQISILFVDENSANEGELRIGNKTSKIMLAPAKTKQKEEKPESNADEKSDKETDKEPAPKETKADVAKASFPINYPLGAFGTNGKTKKSSAVLFENATVWTCGKDGKIEGCSVLVIDGKIAQVAKDIQAPKDAIVIDATGKHLTPGIIDCHSHMGTDSGVNESGQTITAEVRIGDFINCDDITIYRQLAGGVTTANILHGSANPIGGQNQVIKLRWGKIDEAMKFAEAPEGIKFALGENVKRSRDPDSTRYPKSRMGVEQILVDEFRAGLAYQQRHDDWKKNHSGLPPRVDLELEAISEILNGTRWIHCHSYRQDEILALIRVLDGFKIQIGTFQHILEGYKVADEMREHGAMGSGFSDWWAYKFEVFDAIPFGGALMHNAGVVVSFNSDDRELARHLNHEAAKAVKYGGVPEEEALKFVTLNPAKQLRIDQYVGSIEKGKHGDLVLWSGHPLSPMARCEQTWIEGENFFHIDNDKIQRKNVADMREALIQKILASGEDMKKPGERGRVDPSKLWPFWDEFCKCNGKQK